MKKKTRKDIERLALAAHAWLCGDGSIEALGAAHEDVEYARSEAEFHLCSAVSTLVHGYPESDEARHCVSTALVLFDSIYVVQYPEALACKYFEPNENPPPIFTPVK